MRKPIALFDIDNTIYDGFSYFALLQKHVDEKLIQPAVLDNALKSMQAYKIGQKDYETVIVELLDIYALGLQGASYQDVLRSTQEFYANSTKFFEFVRPVMAQFRSSHDLRLVTGEPQFVAEAVASVFDVGAYSSSEYELSQGVFTGKVARYLASRDEKLDAIKHFINGYETESSFAFGDSEGDIEMLRSVRYAICLNATEGLQKVAKKEGWQLPTLNEVEPLVAQLLANNRQQ
ncbi:MAG TPA: HAD-IB family phosphatase [Candidatus Saccharimonadales bacterium]